MSDTEIVQVVVFRLLDDATSRKEEYGVGIESVKEIRPMENITRVPKSSSSVLGVMNLRGQVISVINPKEKLGFPVNPDSATRDSSRILVAETGNSINGLLVDEVDEVMRIPTKDIDTGAAASESGPYVTGLAKTNDRLIILLDLKKLLGDNSEKGKKVA